MEGVNSPRQGGLESLQRMTFGKRSGGSLLMVCSKLNVGLELQFNRIARNFTSAGC